MTLSQPPFGACLFVVIKAPGKACATRGLPQAASTRLMRLQGKAAN
jgi:hypothetical protein